MSSILTPLILGPLAISMIGILIGWASPRDKQTSVDEAVKRLMLAISLLIFAIVTFLWIDLSKGLSTLGWNDYLLFDASNWIPSIGVSWIVGVDGLSFPMVWLTAFLVPVSMIVSWNEPRGRYFHSLLLFMESALLGVFVALDMMMFYIFYEFTLIPMFFLILNWGGDDRRYAAQKFMIYTFTASVIMLAGLLATYWLQGDVCGTSSITGRCFDLTISASAANAAGSSFLGGLGMQRFVFLLFLIGFLTKLPSVPVHTWLPDAHVQAPTAGSMLLAGVMLKMGGYGLLRFGLLLFPGAVIDFRLVLIIFGMISVVYGAFVCLGQTNLKRMIAYSSISHMGLILIGLATLTPLGITGAIFMLFAHGLISPLLFGVCGAFKHHYHTMEIGSMRGLARHAPWFAAFMMIGWMASLGLPLLAGFVAELTILIAFWQAYGWWVIPLALTLVLTAGYYLWSMQRTIFEGGLDGELPEGIKPHQARDLSYSEIAGFFLLTLPILLFGILPFLVWEMMANHSAEVLDLTVAKALGWGG